MFNCKNVKEDLRNLVFSKEGLKAQIIVFLEKIYEIIHADVVNGGKADLLKDLVATLLSNLQIKFVASRPHLILDLFE